MSIIDRRGYLAVSIIVGYTIVAMLFLSIMLNQTLLFILGLITAGTILFAPSIVLNIMMVHIAIAASSRSIDRRWLLLPLCAYGLWFGSVGAYDLHAKWLQQELLHPAIPPNLASNDHILIVRGKPWQMESLFAFGDWVRVSPSTTVYGGGLRLFAGSKQDCATDYAERPRKRFGGFVRLQGDPTQAPSSCVLADPSPEPSAGLLITRIKPQLSQALRSYEISRVGVDGTRRVFGVVKVGTVPFIVPWPLLIGIYPIQKDLPVNIPKGPFPFEQDEQTVANLIGLPVNPPPK